MGPVFVGPVLFVPVLTLFAPWATFVSVLVCSVMVVVSIDTNASTPAFTSPQPRLKYAMLSW